MTGEYLGYHFVSEDRKERWGDQRLIEAGKTYTVKPPIKLCKKGLHASERAIDALGYAPGPIVCKVRLSGQIIRDTDKAVATERTVLALADATVVLHEFACICAEDALHLVEKNGQKADKRSWAAIETKRKWLKGEASDSELDAARDAAGAAAWAARAAARDAARDAAGAAAWAAAWDARDAAGAARDAAGAAAGAAAWAAAWAAAGAAARDAQNTLLERLLDGLLERVPV